MEKWSQWNITYEELKITRGVYQKTELLGRYSDRHPRLRFIQGGRRAPISVASKTPSNASRFSVRTNSLGWIKASSTRGAGGEIARNTGKEGLVKLHVARDRPLRVVPKSSSPNPRSSIVPPKAIRVPDAFSEGYPSSSRAALLGVSRPLTLFQIENCTSTTATFFTSSPLVINNAKAIELFFECISWCLSKI